MSEKMRESMSALMDGEATDFEARRILEGMDSPDMRETWARYHLASAAMKRDAAAAMPQIDISAAVSQAIAKEDALVDTRNRPMKTVAGFATAATIAFAAVIGIQGFDIEDERNAPLTASSSAPASSRVMPVSLADASLANSVPRFTPPPISAPSATLASNASFSHGLQSGIQPVALSSNVAYMEGRSHPELSAASQLAAQRQLETYLARHAELAGSWRPASAAQASGSADAHKGQWRAQWLPNGYRLVAINKDVASDSATPVLTSVYSNGLAAFSVFVRAANDEPAMDMRRGATVACSRRIQSSGTAYNATVVGEIPQPAAERIATSVYQVAGQ